MTDVEHASLLGDTKGRDDSSSMCPVHACPACDSGTAWHGMDGMAWHIQGAQSTPPEVHRCVFVGAFDLASFPGSQSPQGASVGASWSIAAV